MLCIQEELEQMSVVQPSSAPPGGAVYQEGGYVVPMGPMSDTGGGHHREDTDSSPEATQPVDSKQHGWIHGIFGCLRPVLSIIGKATNNEIKGNQQDDWEIPFETISNLQWLGSGAQGAVFSGVLNYEVVAVKKVREPKETDIRNLRKLNHPSIVKFKGVCTQAPCYCIIMEYCPLGPLYDFLKKGEIVPPARLVNWAKQIASGMHYLHSHKIIHRDLKSPK